MKAFVSRFLLFAILAVHSAFAAEVSRTFNYQSYTDASESNNIAQFATTVTTGTETPVDVGAYFRIFGVRFEATDTNISNLEIRLTIDSIDTNTAAHNELLKKVLAGNGGEIIISLAAPVPVGTESMKVKPTVTIGEKTMELEGMMSLLRAEKINVIQLDVIGLLSSFGITLENRTIDGKVVADDFGIGINIEL